VTALLFALAGLVGLVALFASAGLQPVVQAVEAAGWTGLLALSAWQLLLTLPLALAWGCVLPGVPLRALAWARLVREAVGTCLPFTPVGGMVVGARVLAARVGWARAGASTAADLTLEFVGQIAFVIGGTVLLLLARPDSPLKGPLILAILLSAGVAAATLAVRGRGVRALVGRIGLPQLAGGAPVEGLAAALDAVYARPARLAAAAALHLLAWIASGVATYWAFRWLGAPVKLGPALAIEALLSFARAITFFVPAGLGVQEAVYVGLAGLYGVGPAVGLGVSLLRRGRELVVGLPVLLAWQGHEIGRLWRRPADARR